MLEMRKVLCQTLDDILSSDDRAIVIDGDLAVANGTQRLHTKYPKRAFDAGISEAQMLGMAAGLSAYGYKPFIISFTAFATRRIVDQIAVSGCYAKQNIKIIGTDSGVTAQTNGGTHMSFEDIGIMRCIPGMKVFEPTDGRQLASALPQIYHEQGCMYIRMMRKEMPNIFDQNYQCDLYRAERLITGSDVTLIGSGITVESCQQAAKILIQKGISVDLLAIHMVKPIDEAAIIESAKKTSLVITVENHNIIGGLYSAVAEVLSAHYPVKIKGLGVKDHFGEVGSKEYLMDKYGFSTPHIVKAVEQMLL